MVEFSSSKKNVVEHVGDNNSINVGDNNFYKIINCNPNRLTKSEIYTLLLKVSEIDEDKNLDDYDLKIPDELNHKLKYNRAPKFVYKSKDAYSQLMTFNNVISSFTNSELIIRKVSSYYYDHANYDENMNKIRPMDGDQILDLVYQDIYESIKSDSRNGFDIEKTISEEKINLFIILLLTYSLEKCKILENPLGDSKDDNLR
ncbi:hypothetical protein J3U50_07250 [Lactobacillus sp. B3795]|uniref:hypothetical protein n=1 Tax=Lactobacillus sp. B3795 TaxID=2818036 RepID=UPI00265D3D5A|nr:hypothetical protein [Lactobacillus sp. B3795]MCX8743787.1 hypothetical protein [Lactobacillus sp. B3795]